MKISVNNILFDTIRYSDQGTIQIPIDAKILSIGFDGFDFQIVYQHVNPSNPQLCKLFYWYKIGTCAYNDEIYSNSLELKYGTYFKKYFERNTYLDGHILYQVEKTIDEIREDKLNYLLD